MAEAIEPGASVSAIARRIGMARSTFIYTLRQVASMIGENLELIQEVTANSDNISEGELVYVSDGSEDGTKGLTEKWHRRTSKPTCRHQDVRGRYP
ncbi:hypothetical protein [Agrobacterium tumefaciens]|uniref:hypothetical protein n=1 Tax=Agrobacterium tumefaciens TaxID=358 RepID=UPI003AF523A9